jgi:hypothetical protein
VQVTPLAVIEESAEGEHRVAVYDDTARRLRGLIMSALAMVLVFCIARWLVGRIPGHGPAAASEGASSAGST